MANVRVFVFFHVFFAGFLIGLPSSHSSDEQAEIHYWYSNREVSRNWIKGELSSITEGRFEITDEFSRKHCFVTNSRSRADQARLKAVESLISTAAALQSSGIIATDSELTHVNSILRNTGCSSEFAMEIAGKIRTDMLGGLDDVMGPFRWVELNGVEYPIVSLRKSANCSGYTRLTIRDHGGNYRDVGPLDFSEITLLPRLWNQATYKPRRRITSTGGWPRGPSIGLSTKAGADLLVFKELALPDEYIGVWTDPKVVSAYENIAKSKRLLVDAKMKLVKLHVQRHQITGDRLFAEREYASAAAEYDKAWALQPANTDTLLRLGHANIWAGDTTEGIAKLEECFEHSDDGDISGFAALELLSRFFSNIAIKTKADFEAKSFHNRAKAYAIKISDPNYLANNSKRLPSHIVGNLTFRKNNPVDYILLRRSNDLTRRSNSVLRKGIQQYQNGFLERALRSAAYAKKLFGEVAIVEYPSQVLSSLSYIGIAANSDRNSELNRVAEKYQISLEYATTVKHSTWYDILDGVDKYFLTELRDVNRHNRTGLSIDDSWSLEQETAYYAYSDLRLRYDKQIVAFFASIQEAKQLYDELKDETIANDKSRLLSVIEKLSRHLRSLQTTENRINEFAEFERRLARIKNRLPEDFSVSDGAKELASAERRLEDVKNSLPELVSAISARLWPREERYSRMLESDGEYLGSVRYATEAFTHKAGLRVDTN